MADMRLCKICGSPFYSEVASKLCCSPECSEENNRLHSKENKAKKRAEKAENTVSKEPVKKRENTCDRSCDGCVYKGVVAGGSLRYCRYVFETGKLRPCPPGKGCTVKRSNKLTPEERRQREVQRRIARQERLRQQRMRTVTCSICGKEFQTTDGRKKVCSKECHNETKRMAYQRYDAKRRGSGLNGDHLL